MALADLGFEPADSSEVEGKGLKDERVPSSLLERVRQGYPSEKVDRRFQLFQMGSWSEDAELAVIRFDCIFDMEMQFFYAQVRSPASLADAVTESDAPMAGAGPVTKGTVLTLLDVAEALSTSKIHILIDPKHTSFATLVRMFLYVGFTMKSSKKSSKLLKGDFLVLEYDIVWSAANEENSSSSEDSSVGSTHDEGSPLFSYRNDCTDVFDDEDDLDESADVTTPPFSYRD